MCHFWRARVRYITTKENFIHRKYDKTILQRNSRIHFLDIFYLLFMYEFLSISAKIHSYWIHRSCWLVEISSLFFFSWFVLKVTVRSFFLHFFRCYASIWSIWRHSHAARETISATYLYCYGPSGASTIYAKIGCIKDIPESPTKIPFAECRLKA